MDRYRAERGETKEEKRPLINRRRFLLLIDLPLSTPLDPGRPAPKKKNSSRSFCSKKLRRLSCSLGLNALTQRGKFVKRKIEPEAATEVG